MSDKISDEELDMLVGMGTITRAQADRFRGKTIQEISDLVEKEMQKKLEGWDRL